MNQNKTKNVSNEHRKILQEKNKKKKERKRKGI